MYLALSYRNSHATTQLLLHAPETRPDFADILSLIFFHDNIGMWATHIAQKIDNDDQSVEVPNTVFALTGLLCHD